MSHLKLVESLISGNVEEHVPCLIVNKHSWPVGIDVDLDEIVISDE